MRTLLFFLFTTLLFGQSKETDKHLILPALVSDNMVLQQSSSVGVWGWAEKNKEVMISADWNSETLTVKTDASGKWKTKIKTPVAGGPFSMKISTNKEQITLNNVLIGEVWMGSGQSNMEMPMAGYNNQPINDSNELILSSKNQQIRLFTVKRKTSKIPLYDCEGSWQEASPETVADFSAVAYNFAKQLNNTLGVPIGIINSSWGGTPVEAWIQLEAVEDEVTLEEQKLFNYNISENKREQDAPAYLFNGMINPILDFSLKGVIWYQGESNRNQPRLYSKTFPLMIQNWRDLWKSPKLSFYYVQIAPFDYSKNLNSAYLRESQLETLSKTDNIGMVVTLDIGEENNIHPAEKQLVGKRLAYWALANDYGIKKIGFSGPKYKSNEIEGDKMTLKFDFAEKGLSTFGHPLNDFEIAGQDRVFYPAEAKILRNKTIQVHSEKVKNPVAVRYAWKNFLVGSLFNTQKLPASSFRTDDWEDDFNE